MTLTLRYMQTDDIKQVSAIDRLSFDPPWPPNSYAFEINQSTVSHMLVLEESHSAHNGSSPSEQGIRHFLTHLWNRNNGNHPEGTIIGYGGLWKIGEEAHISTVAIHPKFRGQSYGEILLAGMIGKAIAQDADYIVLEVRVSNIVAQGLYRKYGFIAQDIKENYYRSDNEDAYDMRLIFDDALIEKYYDLYTNLQNRRAFVDQYSECPHPRFG